MMRRRGIQAPERARFADKPKTGGEKALTISGFEHVFPTGGIRTQKCGERGANWLVSRSAAVPAVAGIAFPTRNFGNKTAKYLLNTNKILKRFRLLLAQLDTRRAPSGDDARISIRRHSSGDSGINARHMRGYQFGYADKRA
jgi:hypothetical protein